MNLQTGRDPASESLSKSEARVGRVVIALFCAGAVLEVIANGVCHLQSRETSLDECLSLLAVVCLASGGLFPLLWAEELRSFLYLALAAAVLIFLSKCMDVAGSIKALNPMIIIGRDYFLHKMIKDCMFAGGAIVLLMTCVLAIFQAHFAKRRMALQNEALIRETQERRRLGTAIEQSAEAVMMTDAEGVIEYVNPAFERLTGYSRDEVMGRTPRLLRSGKHDARFYRHLWKTISRGEVWHGHFFNQRKDGSLFEEEAIISCVRDESGQIINYIAAKQDITAQVSLENQLRQAQKMEVIGAFAGRIAHDFGNILALILGHSEMALGQLPENHPVRANIQRIAKAGNRASNLVKQLLTFSRRNEPERIPVQIHLIVREVLDALRVSLPPEIELRDSVQACGLILADPTQVHQVVMNLCTNAIQAINGDQGKVEVELSTTKIGAFFNATAGRPAPGSYVRLAVCDTGHGIDPIHLPRIFDPFFTTKKQGQGTGLGLSTVHGIVTSYNGAIAVHSLPEHGTTFEVYFPCLEDTEQIPEASEDPPATGNERILFVDDDEDIGYMAQMALSQLGYTVSVNTKSPDTLRAFQERPDDFDLLITDQIMPEMSGMELAQEILEIRPGFPIIMITGYGQGITAEQASLAGIADFLMKPFTTFALSTAVRQALDSDRMARASNTPM